MRIIPYFAGVARLLRARGVPCLFPRLPAAGSVAERSRALAAQLSELAGDRIALVGHSMGGLDARHFVQNFDADRRVRWLVTLGTPHRGTDVAEHLLRGTLPLARLAQRLWRPALEDMTPETCARRNDILTDRPDVHYLSYAGERAAGELPIWLRPYAGVLSGPNDGLVTVASAAWGVAHEPLRTDHFEMVGWNLALPGMAARRPFSHRDLFAAIVDEVCRTDATTETAQRPGG